MNECLETPTICGPLGSCSNVPGSYRCVCPDGYTLDDAGAICVQQEELDYDDYDCGQDYCDEDVSQNCRVSVGDWWRARDGIRDRDCGTGWDMYSGAFGM